ncbi:Uncharacterised protein [Klebsiella pneumoniae]|nr:Uncharacterised protein [Klebsiella pneumoniae]SYD96168.1 Uncharacterised protein [Klebsiella pneumoniae]
MLFVYKPADILFCGIVSFNVCMLMNGVDAEEGGVLCYWLIILTLFVGSSTPYLARA